MSRSGTPNSMVLLDGGPLINNRQNETSKCVGSSTSGRYYDMKQVVRENSLEIVQGNSENGTESFTGATYRHSDTVLRQRQAITPNKQVSLMAVRKKADSYDHLSDKQSVNSRSRPDSATSTATSTSSAADESQSQDMSVFSQSQRSMDTNSKSQYSTSSTIKQSQRMHTNSSKSSVRETTATKQRPLTTNASNQGGKGNRKLSTRAASPQRASSSRSTPGHLTRRAPSRSPIGTTSPSSTRRPIDRRASPSRASARSRSPSPRSHKASPTANPRSATKRKESKLSRSGSQVASSESSDSVSSAQSGSSSGASYKSSFRPPTEADRPLTPKHERQLPPEQRTYMYIGKHQRKGKHATDVRLQDIEDSDEYDTDLEDAGGGEDSSDDEEEERKAPNQLLMEFVQCLMDGDLENAKKLCKMVLIYEPNNPEAIKFQSLIDEKISLEAELAEMSDSDTSSEADDDDGSDDDETDDETDDDGCSDSDDDDDGDDDDDSGSDDGASVCTATTACTSNPPQQEATAEGDASSTARTNADIYQKPH